MALIPQDYNILRTLRLQSSQIPPGTNILMPQVSTFSAQRSNNGLGLLGYSIFRCLRLTGLHLPDYNALDPSGDDPLQFVSNSVLLFYG